MIKEIIRRTYSAFNIYFIAFFMLASFLAITLISLALYAKTKGQQRIITINQAIELASNYGNFVKNSIDKDLLITKTLANNISNYEDLPIDCRRSSFRSTHLATFLNNSHLYNLFTICDSNIVDRDKCLFYFSTFRDKSNEIYQRDTIYYNPESNDWYTIPKNTLNDYISEPYFWKYPNRADSVFEISIVSPIISKGHFIGIVGLDKRLDTLQREISGIKPFQDGFVFLISGNSTIVSFPDPKLIGASFKSILNDEAKSEVDNILNSGHSEPFHFLFKERDYMSVFLPIKYGSDQKFWAIGIAIPDEVVLEPITQHLIKVVIVISVFLFVVIFFTILIWHKTLDRKIEDKTSALQIALNKAEQADKLKSAFLANFSHELRTPLNAIVGFSSIIASENLPEDKKRNYMNLISSNCEMLIHLFSDVVELSKAEAGLTEIKLSKINIHSFLKNIYLKFCENRPNKQDIDWIINLKAADIDVSVDPVKLEVVLCNLISNAFKYTEKGFVELGFSLTEKNIVQFYVKDTGIGIPEDKRDSIFKRFVKIEEDQSKLYRGVGIGLALSEKLVSIMGGKIWFESEAGKGAIFYFTVPNSE
jgi:signal transduction histidine kinase